MRIVTPTTTTAATGALGLAAWGRHHLRDWGARREERLAVLPGDELVAEPAATSTLAVTVHAAPEDVWSWLAQIGQDRGGLYSYQRLENLVGLQIHNADEVRPEWQLRVGDRVVLVPAGWGPLPDGYSLPVVELDPGRSLVLLQSPPEHPWRAVWSFHLLPEEGCRTRLLARSREHLRPGRAGTAQRVTDELMRPVTTLMTHRMLTGIATRAERVARPRAGLLAD
ncbi:MAG: SRPBCC family protein [Actinomycetota bacterium]